MNQLQQMFDSKVDEITDLKINEFLAKSLKDNFLEQNIILSDEKISEIVKQIREEKEDELDINIEDEVDSEIAKNLKIDLSDIDMSTITNELTKKVEKLLPALISDTSKTLFNHLKRDAEKNVELTQSDLEAFKSRLEKRWRKPFILFEMYLALIYEAGFDANIEYRKNCVKNPDVVFDVLIKLHGRGLQIGNEVITLIKDGFADGAHARWRTLHEVAVVSQFIKKHGKDVAEKYYQHTIIESYKATLQYQRYSKALKQKSFSKKEVENLKKDFDNLIKKFGKSFEGQYGWAAAALKNSRPTFADIEKDIGLDLWRPYYKMASHNVHANPKGISFRLGALLDKNSQIILAGRTNSGFIDPAHGTAISLLQITSTILTKKHNIDSLVLLTVLQRFERLIGEEFLRVQKKIESEHYKNKKRLSKNRKSRN